ncbi:MAG TPA: ABC transporter substrate-binding protein [Methylomirabilota bacterium]|nr:ABC transporter substrate-binding protein [Methylomirabilota bacterium]
MTTGPLRALAVALALAGAWLAAPPAEGQRTSPVRIGALTESWGPTTLLVGLRDGLQELGYREDRDFSIGVRFTQGDPAELPAAARDLVRLGVDLIVASDSTNAIRAARMATDRIPIVFVGGSEVVESGVVKSFAHPGGNITGVADIDVELVPKRMELFREMVPGLKRVLFAYDAGNPLADALLRAHRDAARRLGLVLVERPVRSQEEAQAAFAGFRRGEADGILSPRLHSLNIPGFILEIGAKATPTMFHSSYYVERGGLASYGADRHEMGRQAARIVSKILKGARPADLPIEQANTFELVVNLKTARALDLTVPESVLLRAGRIIHDGALERR